jgi:hypothetical protein
MEEQNENVRFPKWIIVIMTISLFFVTAIVIYIFFRSNNEWVGFACWFLVSLLLIFTVGFTIQYCLKLTIIMNSQQLKNLKTTKENELQKHLADKHHDYRLEALKYEIKLKELDIEKLKTEKGIKQL